MRILQATRCTWLEMYTSIDLLRLSLLRIIFPVVILISAAKAVPGITAPPPQPTHGPLNARDGNPLGGIPSNLRDFVTGSAWRVTSTPGCETQCVIVYQVRS